MDSTTLATELLREVKAQAKRWFIAFCIMVALELSTIIGFVWYISLPVEEETVTQDNDGDNNTIIGIGDSYGNETSSEKSEESNQK